MNKPKATLRISLWMEGERGTILGMGRYLLLTLVDELGSLKKAAQAMNMSYRAAWGKMKQAEDAMGTPLIEKHGSNRSGYKLTDSGRELITQYSAWLKEVEEYAVERAQKTLGWPLCKYEDKKKQLLP